MTRLLSGPARSALYTRGSTHIGSSGLLVLGLGSLVLLTGLATPDRTANDVVALGGATAAFDPLLLLQWLAGAAMLGLALVGIGLRRQAQTLFLLVTAPA